MRISDWSSDVCSSDLPDAEHVERDEDQRWLVPDHTWHRRNYEHAIMHYIATGDDDKAADIETAFRDSNAVLLDADSWPAFVEYMRLFFSKGGQLAKLKMLAEKHPTNARVIEYLARAYRELGEDRASAESFLAADELEADTEKKISLLGNAVDVAVEKDRKSTRLNSSH